jgi:hypothetical protein
MFVCCECCVLSGRGLCDELITRPEESYRLWCVIVCDLENLMNEEAMTRVGSQHHKKKLYKFTQYLFYEKKSAGTHFVTERKVSVLTLWQQVKLKVPLVSFLKMKIRSLLIFFHYIVIIWLE